VIGTRTVHIVTDKAEKIRGLNAIMKQATQKSEWDYHDKMIESVAVFRIDVDKISCKSH
jgi:nitroimidazol reductase NimA-like FMN-containing flavoprotein (pyridoxamine 5'-phosphate oxidase superfamily)